MKVHHARIVQKGAMAASGESSSRRGHTSPSVREPNTTSRQRACTGRNPRSGAIVVIDQKSIPFFKSGKEMRQRLNRSET
jgi:integration host factor subunit beta